MKKKVIYKLHLIDGKVTISADVNGKGMKIDTRWPDESEKSIMHAKSKFLDMIIVMKTDLGCEVEVIVEDNLCYGLSLHKANLLIS